VDLLSGVSQVLNEKSDGTNGSCQRHHRSSAWTTVDSEDRAGQRELADAVKSG
jgi:hypothetical protein